MRKFAGTLALTVAFTLFGSTSKTQAQTGTPQWEAPTPPAVNPSGGSLSAGGTGTWTSGANAQISTITAKIDELSPPAGIQPYSGGGVPRIAYSDPQMIGVTGNFTVSFRGLPRPGSYKITMTFIFKDITTQMAGNPVTLTGTVTVGP
jgi:hypothetical protein